MSDEVNYPVYGDGDNPFGFQWVEVWLPDGFRAPRQGDMVTVEEGTFYVLGAEFLTRNRLNAYVWGPAIHVPVIQITAP